MIQYTIEKKASPADRSKSKYYAKIVRGSTLTTKKIAALLQERTTLEKGEIYGFLLALSKGIRYYVTDSYTVEVAGLGIFIPTLKANSVDTEEELKASNITKKGVIYRPTSDMKAEYQQIKFAKANLDSKSVINASTTTTPDSGDDNGNNQGGSGGNTGGGGDFVG